MKCDICKKTIPELFFQKIKGTYIKDAKGKLHTICFACQKECETKENILKKL